MSYKNSMYVIKPTTGNKSTISNIFCDVATINNTTARIIIKALENKLNIDFIINLIFKFN